MVTWRVWAASFGGDVVGSFGGDVAGLGGIVSWGYGQ